MNLPLPNRWDIRGVMAAVAILVIAALMIMAGGCAPTATHNQAQQAVGNVSQPTNEAQANVKTAVAINTQLVPHTDDAGQPLLATQKGVLVATGGNLDEIQTALGKATKAVGDLTAERDAYVKLYHDIHDSWLERGYRWVKGVIVFLCIGWGLWFVLTFLTPFMAGPLGPLGAALAVFSRVTSVIVPGGSWAVTVADNLHFRGLAKPKSP
jgi:hypothetical protein